MKVIIITTTHDLEQAEFVRAKFADADLSAQIIEFERQASKMIRRQASEGRKSSQDSSVWKGLMALVQRCWKTNLVSCRKRERSTSSSARHFTDRRLAPATAPLTLHILTATRRTTSLGI